MVMTSLRETGKSRHLRLGSERLSPSKTLVHEVVVQTKLLGLTLRSRRPGRGQHERGLAGVPEEVHRLSDRTETVVKETTAIVGALRRTVRTPWDA